MIIFLSGPDSYRRTIKEREIIEVYRKKHGSISDDRFDFSQGSEIEDLGEFLMNSSMFDTSKLAVIESLPKVPAAKLAKVLKPYLKDDSNTTILIVSENEPPAALRFLKEKPAIYQEFPLLSNKALGSFIQTEAVRRGLKLKPEIIQELAQAFEGDSWSIITELDKLEFMGKQPLDLSKPAPEYFELINTLKYSRDVKLKVIALESILSDRKDDAARVFNSIGYRSRDRKEAELFADYDVSVKSGKLDYEEILLDLALHP
jgi:hypothetical protein